MQDILKDGSNPYEKTGTFSSKIISFVYEWILPIGIEILAVLAIIEYLFFVAFVPTGSMIPTIAEKSWLFSTRLVDKDNIKRGDIIVFYSEETHKTLIKRVVGLPGETVDIVDGAVYINGSSTPLAEDYVKNHSHETKSFAIPEGCYLFLGDNRANSADARFWKNPYISKDKILGKALVTIFPFNNFGLLK
ncbi:MAG: signal peptidase I [Oscillospiraceae bacterium]|nr:signal peptidase I [Oscillospiraceae bacterium]